MLFVLLCITSTVLLGLSFKIWTRIQIRVLPGVLHNYIACSCIALMLHGRLPWASDGAESIWLYYALGLSVFFISGFYIFGLAIRWWGMAIVTAFQKLSLLLSVLFAMVYFGERPVLLQGLGILLGLAAIPNLLYHHNKEQPVNTISLTGYISIIATFLISSIIEIVLMVVEKSTAMASGNPGFIAVIFTGALILGLPFMFLSRIERKAFFTFKHMIWGWLLGIPNYFSIYFLMRSLGAEYPSSVVLPIINTGTILVSALVGIYIFGETFSKKNAIGMVMAILAVLLLTLNETG